MMPIERIPAFISFYNDSNLRDASSDTRLDNFIFRSLNLLLRVFIYSWHFGEEDIVPFFLFFTSSKTHSEVILKAILFLAFYHYQFNLNFSGTKF